MKMLRQARTQLADSASQMGPLTLVRAAEEHAGPHSGWFWDPTCQGGGVLSDMGCHSIAVGRYLLTPADRPTRFLQARSVSAHVSLLKWGQPRWRAELLERHGIDYTHTPAEDFATGLVTYTNPETGRETLAQFTVSWMYDKQGLRLLVDGIGPGYALEANSLRSPLEVFIGDAAASSVADAELALEKATACAGCSPSSPTSPICTDTPMRTSRRCTRFGTGDRACSTSKMDSTLFVSRWPRTCQPSSGRSSISPTSRSSTRSSPTSRSSNKVGAPNC